MKINIKVVYKLVVCFLLVIASHIEGTQNSKFVISMHYLKKEWSDKVDFLCADKHQTILQVDTWWAWPGLPKLPKISALQNICNISGKK